MKRYTLLMLLIILTSISGNDITVMAQNAKDACTSIMVGKKASTDGSVITSHTCDSWYRTWMNIVPAQDYPRDTIMSVYEGTMHTEHADDRTGVKEKGTIPQAKHTYRFLNTAYPCLNEHQLGIGETTYGGRDTMENKAGMFMIEELARVALERCTTAREAIRLMGELIKKYGYGDSGECLTIADPNEVWIFEVQGEGPKKIGGVWAAQRIPDDEIAVSANVGNYFDEPKNYSVRELYIMQQLAPSKGFTADMEELPVSVRPDSLVSVERVAKLLGSYYEGTDQSLSCKIDSLAAKSEVKGKAMITNPWMRPDEITLYGKLLNDSTMQNIRTVSVSWCAYSTIIQLRSWLPDEIGGVAWICLDNPGESPRFPVFSGNTTLPMMLNVCGQHRLRDDAALWHYRQANRLATVRWANSRQAIEEGQQYFLDKGKRELPFVEQTWQTLESEQDKKTFLDGYTRDFFGATITRWDELYRKLTRQLWVGF